LTGDAGVEPGVPGAPVGVWAPVRSRGDITRGELTGSGSFSRLNSDKNQNDLPAGKKKNPV